MKALIGTDESGKKFRANPKRMSEYNNCKIEYRDVSAEEITELRIPEAMVTVKIPIQVFMQSEELQNKIKAIDLIYNGLDRRTVDGYLYIENIDTHDVPEYLSAEEYTRMKEAGVIFPDEIISLFEIGDKTPVQTVSENEDNEEEDDEIDNLSNEE